MKAERLVGKVITHRDFEGTHRDKVISFDGKLFTLGVLDGKDVIHEYKLSAEDMEWFYGMKVEV